jgi:hypothetical protein
MDLGVRRMVHIAIAVAIVFPVAKLWRDWYRGTLTKEEAYRLVLMVTCLTILNMSLD